MFIGCPAAYVCTVVCMSAQSETQLRVCSGECIRDICETHLSASLIPPFPYLILDRLGAHSLLALPITDCALCASEKSVIIYVCIFTAICTCTFSCLKPVMSLVEM